MKKIIFELTMPSVGSWDGKWTGAATKKTVERSVSDEKAKEILNKNFYFDFRDGWGANVEVRYPNKGEKATGLFSGYEWMINSIINYNEIKAEK